MRPAGEHRLDAAPGGGGVDDRVVVGNWYDFGFLLGTGSPFLSAAAGRGGDRRRR